MNEILPYPWQEDASDHLAKCLRKGRAALDCSDVGTGKTFTALFTVKKLGIPFAVICPKSLIPVWEDACRAVNLKPLYIVSYDRAVRGFQYGKWINSRYYSWTIDTPHLVIADEAHRLRNYKTKTCRLFESGADHEAKFKLLALSATLAESPLHFKALGRWLNLFRKGFFWPWAMTSGVIKDTWGYKFIEATGYREEFLDRLHKTLFPSLGVRVQIAEIPDFPDQIVEFVPVDVTQEALNRVEKLVQELRQKAIEDEKLPIVELLRARQEMELLKVESLVEQAEDILENGAAVAIFLEFIQTIESVAEGLKKHSPLVLTGDTQDRESLVKRFQANENRIIILQSRVGGVGLSLHDTGGIPRVSLISPSYSATTFKQVLGRIRRSGGKSAAIQRIVYVRQSVEEKVVAAVKNKIKNINLILDGDLSFLP